MNKVYNLLLIIISLYFTNNVIGSEELKKSYKVSKQKDLKVLTIMYAGFYGILHGTMTVMSPFQAWLDTDFERALAKAFHRENSFNKYETFEKELGRNFYSLNKSVIRSHRFIAPLVFGSFAWDAYKNCP